MERMNVSIKHVLTSNGHSVALATAHAENAEIAIVVQFSSPQQTSNQEILEYARDEVLRYLDII